MRDAVAAVSNFKYEYEEYPPLNLKLSDLISNYSCIFLDVSKKDEILDLGNTHNKLSFIFSHSLVNITSSVNDISNSLPFVYLDFSYIGTINFLGNIKFNTLYLATSSSRKPSGELTANNLIMDDIEILQDPEKHSPKQYIDVSGIPSNIKYSLEYDEILDILPKEEGGGGDSAGIRMRSITSFALTIVLIATIFAVV
ncbi:hypothetical protein GPJ56_003276 [Histomonas meleagridis]|uniref:uncharacterized protein n=1 Tax=Histomonas meleagridis TaxID=135588 RepID=UPI00355A2814|nr:hypothetical protein GPJ56_003276 [Histomonas meleagridis]KAH0805937.1 hypothetical protein GO595_001268 [Histomonas meleagridis]